MNNWFEVGEEVLLISQSSPEDNGEYIIERVEHGEFYNISHDKWEQTIAYGLGFLGKNGNPYWKESCLRKKHKPSDESFKDMMQTIKSNVRVSEGVV